MTPLRKMGRVLYVVTKPLLAVLAPRGPRVRVEIRRGDEVLLVKSWFSDQKWSLPGGGVERGEAPSRAAVREVYEETGLMIDRKGLSYLTTLPAHYPLHCDLVIYAVTSTEKQLKPLSWFHSIEIIDRKWYNIDDLPIDIGPLTRAVIAREYERFARD